MAQAAFEITWLVRLLEELGVSKLKPVQLTVTTSQHYTLPETLSSMKGQNTLKLTATLLETRS